MKHILFTLALASIAGIANAQHNGHSYTVEGLINDSTLNGQTLYTSSDVLSDMWVYSSFIGVPFGSL